MGNTVSGAKDVHTFRGAIAHNKLPDVSAITYEGLFNEYMFDTKTNKKNEDSKEFDEKDQLIIPTYCYAKSKKPQSLIKAQRLSSNKENETSTNDIDDAIYEYFMTVGLNENFDVNKLKRNKLNLIIVLDHSGSMGSSFSSYNFDKTNDNNKDNNLSKMEVANNAVIAVLSHLNDNDRLGVIKFDSSETVIQELALIKDIDIEKLKKNILAIKDEGGTNMESAYKRATKMYDEITENDDKDKTSALPTSPKDEYLNRVIFLTDAQPNISTEDDCLMGMLKKNSNRKDDPIMTTFIGVGLDFNTELINTINKVYGGNYYSVHSNKQFIKTMDEEFIFMVTPLVFDFTLTLLAEGNSCCIDAVFGSGDDEKSVLDNGEVMNVNTIFPSAHDENDQVQGGVVVLKMKTKDGTMTYNMETNVVYKDGDGKAYKIDDTIQFGATSTDDKADKDYFDNNGIRKSVLLVRYIQLLREWMKYEYKKGTNTVDADYKEIFSQFKQYFMQEMNGIGDEKLNREIKILDKLIQWQKPEAQ